MTGPAAKENMEYLFVGTNFMTTDSYPVLEQHVEDVDVTVGHSPLSVEDTTDVTVTLELYDGSTTTATQTSDYDVDGAVSIENRTVVPSETGTANVSVTVNGKTDTATLDVRTPANVTRTDAQLDTSAILANSTATVTARFENDGGMPGSERLSVSADGETVAEETVFVSGYADTVETVAWSVNETGTYDVTLAERHLGTLAALDRDTVECKDVSAPATVTPGETYAVEATFENTADTPVSIPVSYRSGEQSTDKRVRVTPGESIHRVEFTAAEPTGRTVTHAVTVGNSTQRAKTTVRAPAQFELGDLDGPTEVTEGETITVTATVENVGDRAGSRNVSLSIDGHERVREAVRLDGGETRRVSLDVTVEGSDAVEYKVDTGDDSEAGSITIQTDETPTPSRSEESVDSSDGPRDDSGDGPRADSTSTPDTTNQATTTTTGPGFGIVVTVLAFLGGGVLLARQH
ncbi:Cell surface glycoprotein S-layer protein related protein [Halorhabdus tiamatea SARL4B]|nr:CARDB domain-containing protein [Halorhabdus tiamatea]ERJ06943.1 Cell surface glycoprotein S-layer protein related protein [Halorhabdus tiamatea SARL4B]